MDDYIDPLQQAEHTALLKRGIEWVYYSGPHAELTVLVPIGDDLKPQSLVYRVVAYRSDSVAFKTPSLDEAIAKYNELAEQ